MNPLQKAVSQLGRRGMQLKRSTLAKKYFLNPVVPRALRDDKTGEWHLKKHQISNPKCEPYLGERGQGLKKGDPIPLMLRWYQTEVIDLRHRKKVLRFGRPQMCTPKVTLTR